MPAPRTDLDQDGFRPPRLDRAREPTHGSQAQAPSKDASSPSNRGRRRSDTSCRRYKTGVVANPLKETDGALALTSTKDAEPLVRARGPTFIVTDRRGDIAPAGARELGLFHRDTRHLSHLALGIADLGLTYLSSEGGHDAFNQIDLMVAGAAEGEFLDDPENYLHVRRRQVLDDAFIEEISFTSYLTRALDLEVWVDFDADFADLFEVRGVRRPARGRRRAARITKDRVRLRYRGTDEVDYSTELTFSPTPTELTERRARYVLHLEPRDVQRLHVRARPRSRRSPVPTRDALVGRFGFGSAAGSSAPRPASMAARVERLEEEAAAFREASTRVRCDDAIVQQVFEQSVRDLDALRMPIGPDRILAAGIPWFCAPFGRDALLASYSALLLNPELAASSLRVLAAYQGRREDDVTEEEPGKILHELRFGEMVRSGETPHAPYYGSIDATPLFVIVAHATHDMTGDRALLEELRPAILAALAWIDARSADGTRFVTYARRSARGLDNQGWKDSRAASSFPDGRRAEPPIALCEVQGYCVDAYRRGARVLEILGETGLAERYMARSEHLRSKIEAEMWLERQGRYAFAIDGRGAILDTVVSNLGHLLWSRGPDPGRGELTAKLLLRDESFSGFGIRTLADGQPAYNPFSYHNGTVWPHDNAIIAKGLAHYGRTRDAARVFDGLVAAMGYFRDHRFPELFAGLPASEGNLVRYPVACSPQAWAAAAPFLLLEGILGIQADAPAARLIVRNARLPRSVRAIELENLRVGASRVTIRVRRVGRRCYVDRLDVSGPAIRTEIELE